MLPPPLRTSHAGNAGLGAVEVRQWRPVGSYSYDGHVLKPVPDGVVAAPFRRVYTMHRYFARRPHNLFQKLIEHYTDPGEVVLDPFFGGGVSLVESALADRRAIGIDLNPMAGLITRMELAPFDQGEFDDAMGELAAAVESPMDALFATKCPQCSSFATASWYEVSAQAHCVPCTEVFNVVDAVKVAPATWACPHCESRVRLACGADTPEHLSLINLRCSCGYEGTKKPDRDDLRLWREIPSRLEQAADGGLFIPSAEIPHCNMQRESALHKKGVFRFAQLFQPRALLGWALIRAAIAERPITESNRWLWFAFSASLRYANRMVTRNPGWRGDKPLEWAKPGYWLPPVHLDVNPLEQLKRRADAIRRAKSDQRLAPLHERVSALRTMSSRRMPTTP